MSYTKAKNLREWLSSGNSWLILLAFFPPLYLLLLIQYSAITVPFWDHVDLVNFITSMLDGELSFVDLLKPHNHTRPLVYRLVMVLNAKLTDWDIRSEYIYMFMAIYGTFAAHFWVLRRLTTNAVNAKVFPVTVLLISLVLFSPVGHNNHWWSMMFQLNAANLFIAFGLLVAFSRPTEIFFQILAAISLWLASFTLTNGLFAILAIIITFQITSRKWFRPTKLSLFWSLNLLAILCVYLPGLSTGGSSESPSFVDLAKFVPAYLGSALAGLLWFPFKNMFDLPGSVVVNLLVGAILLLTCGLLIRHSLQGRQRSGPSPSTLILIGFSVFAIISSLVTAWGRASFDDFGPLNANASRYSIFSAYLLMGQIYYVAVVFFTGDNFSRPEMAQIAEDENVFSVQSTLRMSRGSSPYSREIFLAPIIIIFVILSVFSYFRGITVYSDAHRFNEQLSRQYTWGTEPNESDKMIFPNPAVVTQLKADLQRLEIGPYRNRAFNRENLDVGDFKDFSLISEGTEYSQRFVATKNRLKAVLVTLVRPNGANTRGRMGWTVSDYRTNQTIMDGTIEASQVLDWQPVRLKLPFLEASQGVEYVLTLLSDAPPSNALGLPLYQIDGAELTTPATRVAGNSSDPLDLVMNISLDYAD